MNIALILARQGSKSLKDKNIKLFMGKPLMAHSIQAALDSNLFARVIVSTDSEKYAEIARYYGAEVPFLRSKKLSEDGVPSSEVAKDILQRLRSRNEEYRYFAVLQISSPLRTAEDIRESYKVLIEKDADAVITVCKSPYPKPWINVLPPDKNMRNFIAPEFRNAPRQTLPAYYKMHGAIFWGKVASYLKNSDPFTQNTYAFETAPEHSVDIDTAVDFELAKILYTKLQQQAAADAAQHETHKELT